MLHEYHKIEGLYAREEEGAHRLLPGVFRSPEVEYLKNNEWLFTEKLDGMNVRIFWNGHKVSFHGRTDRAQIPTHLLEYLEKTFGGETMEEVFEQVFGEKEVILFGEGYGPKIQKCGSLYRDDVSFCLFDVATNGRYLSRESVIDISVKFGIQCVPEILRGTIQDAVDFVMKNPKSTIGIAMMEGVVGHPVCDLLNRNGKRIIVKVKWRDMKELLGQGE